jgi:predicted nucleic acid-binding protein
LVIIHQKEGWVVIVVDASVVAFLMVEGDLTPLARELFRIDPDWITPPIVNHELLNILAALGSTESDSGPVESVWREARALLGPRQKVPDPSRSLQLAVELGVTGNEAQYLTLAESLKLPLITEEERLCRLVPERTLSIAAFLESFNQRNHPME